MVWGEKPSSHTMTHESNTPTASRRLFLGALLALICVLFVAVIAEIGLRYREHRQAPRRLALMQENPYGTGSHRLRPNLDITVRIEGREVRIRTNEHGMPWRSVSQGKSAGVRRIAIVGDSFAFGL